MNFFIPYYTGVLVCDKSMEQIGIRLATTEDHAPKKKRINKATLYDFR